jgi:hypothetical protein
LNFIKEPKFKSVFLKIEALREHFNSKGAKLSERTNANENINDHLNDLIKNIGCCLSITSTANESELDELETVLNSLLSLIIISPDENTELVTVFCETILNATNPNSSSHYYQHRFGLLKLRILGNLFHGLIGSSKNRYTAFLYLIKCSLIEKNLQHLPTNLDLVKKFLHAWQTSLEETQTLYRLMFETLSQMNESQSALNVLRELLSTYSKENASRGRDDAIK